MPRPSGPGPRRKKFDVRRRPDSDTVYGRRCRPGPFGLQTKSTRTISEVPPRAPFDPPDPPFEIVDRRASPKAGPVSAEGWRCFGAPLRRAATGTLCCARGGYECRRNPWPARRHSEPTSEIDRTLIFVTGPPSPRDPPRTRALGTGVGIDRTLIFVTGPPSPPRCPPRDLTWERAPSRTPRTVCGGVRCSRRGGNTCTG